MVCHIHGYAKKSLKRQKRESETVNRRRQAMIFKTPHRNLKIEQNEHH